VKSALKLKDNGVFCSGTIRSSRKFVLKSILFTSSEVKQLPRGTKRCVVNETHNILAVGWIGNKAVRFISTTDTTDTSTILCQIKDKNVEETHNILAVGWIDNERRVIQRARHRSKKKLSHLNHFVCRVTCYTTGDMKVLFSLSQCRLCHRIHRKAT
jgi:hypothetical protein